MALPAWGALLLASLLLGLGARRGTGAVRS
jgi:hypothetical protein